jgi:hypothetical protein
METERYHGNIPTEEGFRYLKFNMESVYEILPFCGEKFILTFSLPYLTTITVAFK